MSTEAIRQHLIALEVEQREEAEELDRHRAQLQQLLEDVDSKEQEKQARAKAIRSARYELQRAEALEAAHEQASEFKGLGKLVQDYLAIAQDKPWFEGTGNDDAILSHQWQGMLFGSVAKRWILGDWPGLGKTRTAIGWLDLVGAKRVVCVVPADVCDTFAGEIMTMAPHRALTNLYHMNKERRHEALDFAVKYDGIIVINYEIWRADRAVLSKLMKWHADTVVVDEAHGIKSKRTSNYKNVEALITFDNVCAKCGAHIDGLYDREALQRSPARKLPIPCGECGWKMGRSTDKSYANQLIRWESSKSVRNVVFMTGTPILNSPVDLFTMLHLCDPVLFTTENQFLNSYCRKNHFADKWEFREHAVDNLRPLIEGRFLARTYDDAEVELPNQAVHIIPVDLDKRAYPLQYRTIRQLTREAQILLDSGDQMTIMHLIALITRKRQANVWPGGIELRDKDGTVIFSVGSEVQESVKIDRLMERLLQEHATGKRQIIFSQFTTALEVLQERCKAVGIRSVVLAGSTPKKLREKIKTNFDRKHDEEPEYDVVLANYKTGGVGLNLTAATVIHVLDEEWSPGKQTQAYRRTDRIGQIEETTVYVYRIPGTIDTFMANNKHRKEMMIAGFNEGMTRDKEVKYSTFFEALETGEIL